MSFAWLRPRQPQPTKGHSGLNCKSTQGHLPNLNPYIENVWSFHLMIWQPCTPKKGKKWKIVFSKRNEVHHLELLIWASDKGDNASQGIYNPFSGSPHSPSRNGSAPLADGTCAQMTYRLGHPQSLKVMKKIEPSKSAKKNNWALKWWKKYSNPKSKRKKNCALILLYNSSMYQNSITILIH